MVETMGGRQTGKTQRLMLAAPHGALFVWCNDVLHYPKELARKLGREDLRIVSPGWLEYGGWRGSRFPGMVQDHACDFTERQFMAWVDAQHCIRPALSEGEKHG